jgi:hypothetical protein
VQEANTASRTENIAFTVSLEELKKEFDPPAPHNCDFPEYIDLQSDLGIQEWISDALSPADNYQLTIGYHKTPRTGAGSATLKAATKALNDALGGAAGEAGECTESEPPVRSTDLPNRSTVRPKRSTKPSALAMVICDLFIVLGYDLTQLDSGQVEYIAKTVRDIQEAIRDRMKHGPADKVSEALEKTAIALTVFLDPPIDTITHQVQFVILWNASATPSWTLVRFKGPGPASGSLLSATRTKTHTLNIALGPPSSPDTQGALNALQIGTAVANAVNSVP